MTSVQSTMLWPLDSTPRSLPSPLFLLWSQHGLFRDISDSLPHTGEAGPNRLRGHQIQDSDKKIHVSGSFPCEAVAEASSAHEFVEGVCSQWQTQNVTTPVAVKGSLAASCGQTRDASTTFRDVSGQPQLVVRRGLSSSRSPTQISKPSLLYTYTVMNRSCLCNVFQFQIS